MGFWQHLADSYDNNSEALKKTYPLSTTSISNNSDIIAVIVIDGDGNFVRYDKIAKKTKSTRKNPGNPLVNITIPASEESLKRTSTAILPYPIFEEYSYLKKIPGKSDKYIEKLYKHCNYVREYNKKLKSDKKITKSRKKRWEDYEKKIKKIERYGKKNDAYIEQLKNFAASEFATEQVKAIYQYASKGTIAGNLSNWNNSNPKNIINVNDKTNIIFQVEIRDNPRTKVWEDDTDDMLFSAWHQYYFSVKKSLISLDYITGEKEPAATFHPKKISSTSANAKLISGNDKTNYTFRGKFKKSSEAVSIGYNASQKAHQFLRYLINDRGCSCGEQVILSFTIGSMEKLLPPPIENESILAVLQASSVKTESDVQIDLRAETGFDYADALRRSLGGFRHGQALRQHAKTAVIALDAVSDKSGRLSITFYRELHRNDYLEKVADWHSSCKWHQKFWDKVDERYVPYIGAPSVDKIIEAVYGKSRSREDKSYTKIKKSARERLLRCIFDGSFLPIDYVVSAVRRVSNPMSIAKDGKFDRSAFEQILSTACALIRKSYQQRNEEDFKLSIEIGRKDRDYLYGRLLGAADKLEEYALFKKAKGRVVTAAIRYMQAFSQRPFRSWQTIHSCLIPYIQTVKGSFAFNEIQAVKNQFVAGDYENDNPLNGSYLIGYYHERAYIDTLIENSKSKSQAPDRTKTEDTNG